MLSGKSITEENVREWVEEEQAIATDETSRFGLMKLYDVQYHSGSRGVAQLFSSCPETPFARTKK